MRDKYLRLLFVTVVGGIVVNVSFGFLANLIHLPLYMDTIGTIGVACVAGGMPALIVALCTNIISAIFNQSSIYYSIVSILIAIIAGAWLPSKRKNGEFRFFYLLLSLRQLVALLGR